MLLISIVKKFHLFKKMQKTKMPIIITTGIPKIVTRLKATLLMSIISVMRLKNLTISRILHKYLPSTTLYIKPTHLKKTLVNLTTISHFKRK